MRYFTSVFVLIAVLALAGCIGSDSESGENSGDSESGEHGSGTESGENRSDSESGDGGEEAGTQFALDETFDEIRAGARLVLSYDSASNDTTSGWRRGEYHGYHVEARQSRGPSLKRDRTGSHNPH